MTSLALTQSGFVLWSEGTTWPISPVAPPLMVVHLPCIFVLFVPDIG